MTTDPSEIYRSYPWRAATIDPAGEDGRTLIGYAAVFDAWTEVDNPLEGHFMESVSRGAFDKTLKDRAGRVPLLYDHGRHPMVGQMPLGRIEELTVDDYGLRVRARLHDNWLVEPVRDAIRSGAMREMSFRFRPIGNKRVPPAKPGDLPMVSRTEVGLIEVGPATIGVYAGTEMALRAWQAAPPEFRSTVLDLVGEQDMMTDVIRTSPSAGSTTEDPSGAADRAEPTDMVTLRERRIIAARLRGVYGHADPPGSAERRAG